MKNPEHDKFFLLWAFVLGIFFLIIAFWIPGFMKSIEVIRQGIGKQKDETATQWKEQMQKTEKFMEQFKQPQNSQKEEITQPDSKDSFDHNSTSTSYEEKPANIK